MASLIALVWRAIHQQVIEVVSGNIGEGQPPAAALGARHG
jgi:hypothetical protein